MQKEDMKTYRKELWFNVPTRRAFINITPQVDECLQDSGIIEGMALVNAMHITASVFINDDECGFRSIPPGIPIQTCHLSRPKSATVSVMKDCMLQAVSLH